MSNWRPHEPGEDTQAAIIDRVVESVRRPARLNGNTLEVFDVDAQEQLPTQKKLREVLKEIGGSRVTIIFHTRGETQRLYADFVNSFPHHCHYTVEINFSGKRKFFCDLCGGAY
jgi:hypothetical protein